MLPGAGAVPEAAGGVVEYVKVQQTIRLGVVSFRPPREGDDDVLREGEQGFCYHKVLEFVVRGQIPQQTWKSRVTVSTVRGAV